MPKCHVCEVNIDNGLPDDSPTNSLARAKHFHADCWLSYNEDNTASDSVNVVELSTVAVTIKAIKGGK